MKKNITINLCGRLYSIDEDAYQLLSHYTDTLRNYFRRQESGDEIANDIEERIAELFDDLKAQGVEAINIEHVRDIISRIGEVQDIAPDGDTSSEAGAANGERKKTVWASESIDASFASWWNGLKGKRFYRDGKDKVLAGVMSGCAKYFGGSVLIWRIACVVLSLIGSGFFTVLATFFMLPFLGPFMPLILYALVAMISPVANTPEDRLKMKGVEVNPQNLANEMTEASAESEAQMSTQSGAKGCLTQFFHVIGKMIQIVFVTIGTLLFIPFMVFFCMFVAGVVAPKPLVTSVFSSRYAYDFYITNPVEFWVLGICVMAACFIPAYCSLHCALNTFGKVPSMSTWQRFVWVVMFVLAVAGITASGVKIASGIDEKRNAAWEIEWKENEKMRESQTHDGVYMNDTDWEYFQQNGWRLLRHENCVDERYTYSGEYYTGDPDVRYLDAASSGKEWDSDLESYVNRPIIYQAERTDSVPAGLYRLTALARCAENGTGVFIYACINHNGRNFMQLAGVPAYGNIGVQEDGKANVHYPAEVNEIRKDSTRLGFGWSVVTVDSIVVNQGEVVRYGVSTDAGFTGTKCTADWFSATDFKLERIK